MSFFALCHIVAELIRHFEQVVEQEPTKPDPPAPEKKQVLLKRFRNTKTISAARSQLRPISPKKRKLVLELAEAVK